MKFRPKNHFVSVKYGGNPLTVPLTYKGVQLEMDKPLKPGQEIGRAHV